MKSPKEVGLEVGIDSEDAPPAKKSKKKCVSSPNHQNKNSQNGPAYIQKYPWLKNKPLQAT